MNTIKFGELAARTGATDRQLDYWCRANVIPTVNNAQHPGTGNDRLFDESIVPAIKTCVNFTNTFPRLPLDLLKSIIDYYEHGAFHFENIVISWYTE